MISGALRANQASATTEFAATAVLASGSLAYTLRRSPWARRLRVTIDPRRGVIVTVPVGRPGSRAVERSVEPFLREREAWLRRHLERHAAQRTQLAARGALADGSTVWYRGEPHRLRVEEAAPRGGAARMTAPGRAPGTPGETGSTPGETARPVRRSVVSRVGGEDGDELVVRRAASDARPLAAILEAWLRVRARTALEREIAAHAPALRVAPRAVTIRDPRTRWGSASRSGRLSFSWRLVLAPPEALETVVVHELAHLRVFGHGPAFWALVAERRPDHRRWRQWLRDHSIELHGALEPAGTAALEPVDPAGMPAGMPAGPA